MTEPFNGHDRRECGDHRTTGARAWCYDDHSWCSPAVPCRGCELPLVLQRAEQAERERDERQKRAETMRTRAENLAVTAAQQRTRAVQAEAAVQRMRDLLDSYPPGSNFARSGAQALFRRVLDQEAGQ